MIEEIKNGCKLKIDIPLLTNIERDNIINSRSEIEDTIIEQVTKEYIHNKELAIAYTIIKDQKEEIEKLKKILEQNDIAVD